MIHHWSHPHLLRFIERRATFECDACNKVVADSSYMCDTCPFWIHKSCAILPRIHLFGYHPKHPLRLSDSLPEIYHRFKQFCKICKTELHASSGWLYYCDNCRFFAHVHCALSNNTVKREKDFVDDPKLMHLPAPDEPSMNLMMENCIKDMFSLTEDTAIAAPRHINHWSHQHALSLNNRNAIVTTDDHLYQESGRLIFCDGCTKPIPPSSDDTDVFYQCSQCSYSVHRYCAQFPEEMHHRSLGTLKGFQPNISSNDTFYSYYCEFYSDGIRMSEPQKIWFDIWCVSLPEKIKHQAHHHPLVHYIISSVEICEACGDDIHPISEPMVFGCIDCKFHLHVHCLLKPATVKHRWDPHPLRLVRSVEDDVEDHPHDFECEFCSKDIDTNTWFYHCSICDLCFHLNNCMINPYNRYSNVKHGATNIMNPYNPYSNVKHNATNIMKEAHQQDLTFDLNKIKKSLGANLEKYFERGIRYFLKIHPYKFVPSPPPSPAPGPAPVPIPIRIPDLARWDSWKDLLPSPPPAQSESGSQPLPDGDSWKGVRDF